MTTTAPTPPTPSLTPTLSALRQSLEEAPATPTRLAIAAAASLAEQIGQPVLVLDPDGGVLASEATRRQVRSALKAVDGQGEGWNLIACSSDDVLAGWIATPASGLEREAALLGEALAAAWNSAEDDLKHQREQHRHLLRNKTPHLRLTQPTAQRGPVRQAALDGRD